MPIPTVVNKRPLIIGAVCAVAVLFRLPLLLHGGLWRDEANVFVDISAPTIHDFLSRVIAIEYHPPLYFGLIYVWTKVFGATEFTLMLLPFIFSVATVPLIMLLGTAAASLPVGLLAALMFAIAPVAVSNATNYLYPLMGLLCTLLAYLVVRARGQHLTLARWSAIAVVTALVVYTHYIALLFIPLMIVWSLNSPRGIRHAMGSSSALVVGLATFFAWAPVFSHQRGVGLPYTAEPNISEKVGQFIESLAACMPAASTSFALALLSVAIVAAATLTIMRTIWAKPAALGALFVLTLATASAANLSSVRYISPLCGLLYVWLASIAVQLEAGFDAAISCWRRFRVQCAVSLIAALVLLNAVNVLRTGSVPKSGFRSLAAAHAIERSALYVVAPDYLASTFDFYTQDPRPDFIGFVRLQHPEVFTLEGYANEWNDEGVVDRSFATISKLARSRKYLHLVIDRFASNQGRLPYSKTWLLLRRFEAKYELVGQSFYPAAYESIIDFRFRPFTSSRTTRLGPHR